MKNIKTFASIITMTLFSATANANYVSPSTYMNESCEDLIKEHKFVNSEYSKLISESIDALGNKLLSALLGERQAKLKYHARAMNIAIKKKGCVLPKDSKK